MREPEHNPVLIEAEAFEDKGGWSLDSQFMEQMGSAYLIAHGIGTPVGDAVTVARFPKPGEYRVWARTLDWAAPLKCETQVGRFEITVNGASVGVLPGPDRGAWRWQRCNTVDIERDFAEVRLHDLDGFDGRCDAILFSDAPDCEPPQEAEALSAFRHECLTVAGKPSTARYDLVVAGAGAAGLSCAVSAARLGLRTALVHDRPVLGGNNGPEVGVTASAVLCVPPFPRIGSVAKQFAVDDGTLTPGATRHRWEAMRRALLQHEHNLDVFYNMRITEVGMCNGAIAKAIAIQTQGAGTWTFEAPLFADCTGDGNLGYLAGAAFRMGRESVHETKESYAPEEADGLTLATTNPWYAVETAGGSSFPEFDWGLGIGEGTCVHETRGGWRWQSGWDRDTVREAEFIRDYNLAAIYANWSFLKNRSSRAQEYRRWRLAWTSFIAGKRESRRLLGDYVLTQHDLFRADREADAFVTGSYMIDLHRPKPTGRFPLGEFRLGEHIADRSVGKYGIPFRCLYSRDVPNLLMAGRCISATHVAHSTARIINTTGMMGEVIAMGAFLCSKHSATPRRVYEMHCAEFADLAARGVPEN
jgi:hypothetical protein